MWAIIYFSMFFCHIVDDFYLQGILANFKQRKWWEENAKADLYKNDYIISLFIHAFSWSFMIHVPIFIYMVVNNIFVEGIFILLIILGNMIIHAFIDDLKANELKINLIQDQILHFAQVSYTCLLYFNLLQ